MNNEFDLIKTEQSYFLLQREPALLLSKRSDAGWPRTGSTFRFVYKQNDGRVIFAYAGDTSDNAKYSDSNLCAFLWFDSNDLTDNPGAVCVNCYRVHAKVVDDLISQLRYAVSTEGRY